MTEIQALQAEAARQDAIAQALRAEVRAATELAEAILNQYSMEADIAWARAIGLGRAFDQAVSAALKALRDAADLEDPDGVRAEAL